MSTISLESCYKMRRGCRGGPHLLGAGWGRKARWDGRPAWVCQRGEDSDLADPGKLLVCSAFHFSDFRDGLVFYWFL